MTEPTESRIVDAASRDSSRRAQDWRAPTLTVLGDAVELTQSGGAILPDGPGSS